MYINASNKQCWPGIHTYNIPVNIQYTKYKYSTINDSCSGIYKKMI